MIHRRGPNPTTIVSGATDPPSPPPSSTKIANQNGYSNINNGGVKKTKRRIRRSRDTSWMKRFGRILADEDSLVTLIQITSTIIITGCLITLILHFFGTGEEGESGWKNSLLVKTNWMFRPKTMHKKRKDTQYKRVRDGNGLYTRVDMEPSDVYTIPDSLPFVGDKSNRYAELRLEYDQMNLPRIEQSYKLETMPMITDITDKDDDNTGSDTLPPPYDIHNCPLEPHDNYPYAWNLLQILDHWSPDDAVIPRDRKIFQGLCIFDFNKDYEKALNYRKKELPFVVVNDPQVQETAKRWNAPGFMERMLGDGTMHRSEFSESNHFMYWNAGRQMRQQSKNQHPDGRGVAKKMSNWQQPTTMMRMTYRDWLSHANLTEGETVGPSDPHYYFRLIGCGETGPQGECDKGSSEYLFDELPFFQPKENLYIVDPLEQKGIHCRFGMHGVIAENHFDQSRNAIAVMGGERRYILSHPNQCSVLSLLPKGHPSARHSAVDWSNPDLETYPEFAQAEANEIVLQAGDVLYIPTNWFHYIISLNLNFQCNTRSGVTPNYFKALRKCGF
mmetsp:Transcript_5004/g.5318  ORF Transcript_5004/g.5318 Transcript_5004/m.5318 type:complete len:558 (+) Transcript_5004:58-1731(+)